MPRLRRFPEHRYVGVRDRMVFYDCDDQQHFVELEELIASSDLLDRTLLSTFAPDTESEARNRGFRAR